jgi:hypothetical protein
MIMIVIIQKEVALILCVNAQPHGKVATVVKNYIMIAITLLTIVVVMDSATIPQDAIVIQAIRVPHVP